MLNHIIVSRILNHVITSSILVQSHNYVNDSLLLLLFRYFKDSTHLITSYQGYTCNHYIKDILIQLYYYVKVALIM